MEVEERGSSSDFGHLLRRHRLAAGLSQEALAERARMSSDGVSALERGHRRTPQRETVMLLAGALALDEEDRTEFEAAASRGPLPRHRASVSAGPWTDFTNVKLPLSLTSFVGRETELGEIAALVREHRLVTVTGAGGIGKTQTALRVAIAMQNSPAANVAFVDLASVGDPLFVATAIGVVLGIREPPGEALLDKVTSHLKKSAALLVLDNCEHVIDEVARIAGRLVARCERLGVLATSREPLRVAGEYAYRLPSLSVPPQMSAAPRPVDAEHYEALALFCDRARAVDHRFSIDDENVVAISEICRRLDGIPLAIELAAARIGALSQHALVERLNDCLGFLSAGTRTALPRQQTMRATIEWSYNLLRERERYMFELLSVFAGGCTLDMAEAVYADESREEEEVLDLLGSLVDKSLVSVDVSSDEPRYRLLETTRQYARERLVERGEFEAAMERLAHGLVQLSREIAPTESAYNARLAMPSKTLRRISAERTNFVEVLHWSLIRRRNARAGQELAWRVPFSRASIGVRWLTLALEAADEQTPSELIANLEIQLGWCFVDLRDLDNAIGSAKRAVAASQSRGDPGLLAAARQLLGRALTHAWHLDEAELELQQALHSWREIRDRRAIATTLSYLAFVAVRRDMHARAHKLNLEALRALDPGDERGARLIKIELARAEYGLGNYEVALAYSREVLPALEAEAAEGGSTCVILMLNQCAFLLALDQFGEATEVARRALDATLDEHNPRPDLTPYVAGVLAKIAVLRPDRTIGTCRTRRLEKCAKLIGWYEAVCLARGESDPDETFEELSILRREIGEKYVDGLLTEGAALDHDTAVELMRFVLVPADLELR